MHDGRRGGLLLAAFGMAVGCMSLGSITRGMAELGQCSRCMRMYGGPAVVVYYNVCT
jgi:hypothetical protein